MFVMLPVYLEKHGLTRWQIGMADGCFWFASVLGQTWLGPRLDRQGRRPYFLLGSGLMAAIALIYLVEPVAFPFIMALRTLQGLGYTFYLGSTWTWLADHVAQQRRGLFFGVFGLSGLVGGPLGVGLAERLWSDFGCAQLFQSAAGFLIAGLLTLWTLSDARDFSSSSQSSPQHLFAYLTLRPVQRVVWGAFGFGLAVGSLFAFGATYLHSLGIAHVSVLFSLLFVASALARLGAGRWMDRRGPASLVPPALICLGLGNLALALLPKAGSWQMMALVAAGLAWGVGYGAVHPAIKGLALCSLPPDARGRAVSLATASADVGSMSGAILSGIVSFFAGYPMMFGSIGLLVTGLALTCYGEARDSARLTVKQ